MTIALDVAVGVMLLYLLLALLVTTVQELVAGLFATRAKHLYTALAGIVTGTVPNDETAEAVLLVQKLYGHPLIRSLTERAPEFVRGRPSLLARGLPSYLPSKTFAVALLDVLRGTKTASDAVGAGELLAGARKTLEKVTDPQLKRVLTLLVGDVEQLASSVNERSRLVSERLETWFNDRMARASGWYKRRAQYWSLGLGLALAVAFNADTFHVAERLWHDGALRAGAVAAAELVPDGAGLARPAPGGLELVERAGQQVGALEASGLPLGWHRPPTVRELPIRVLGWLVTALAVSLGATFWFEVLSRTIRFRSTGVKVSEVKGKLDGIAAEVLP